MAQSHRTAGILAIGDELVLGQKLDSNSQWLSDRLVGLGIRVLEHATVDDDDGAIAGAIGRLASACDLVVCTGGLGPTEDDRTRAGLARAMGEQLIEDAALMRGLLAWYASRGREMASANRVQALRPVSAEALDNERGTAPGLWGRLEIGVEVACLPGPPGEMRPMFEGEVVRRLRVASGRVIRTRLIHTVGLGESNIAERLGELMDRSRMPLVGTTASGGVVTCRIRFEGDAGDADGAVAQTARAVRERLGAVVFGEGDQTPAGACVDLLRERGETVCTVESCTGGMLGELLTERAGSSDGYIGGWVTYTNEMKHREVGVAMDVFERDGAVSSACASAMALGGLERSGATHALAITGIAGPGGGSEDKPVGTVWIGRASADGSVETRRFLFRGDRAGVRRLSALSALAMLRLKLVGEEMELLWEVEKACLR